MESNEFVYGLQQNERWLAEDSQPATLNSTFVFDHVFFQTPPVAQNMAGSTRFGHTNDFASAFESKSQAQDYLMGLVWIAITFGIIFGIWVLFILFFCVLGKKRVGILSGKPFERNHYYSLNPITNANDENRSLEKSITRYEIKDGVSGLPSKIDDNIANDHNNNSTYYSATTGLSDDNRAVNSATEEGNNITSTPSTYEMNDGISPPESASGIIHGSMMKSSSSHKKDPTFLGIDRIKCVRSIFILSGIIFIVFSWLFVTQGLANAQSTVDELNVSAQQIENLTSSGATLLQNLTDQLNSTTNTVIFKVIDELSNASELCPNDPTFSGNEATQKLGNLSSVLAQTLQAFEGFESTLTFDSTIQSLQHTSNKAHKLYSTTNTINLSSWQSLIAIIPGCCLSLILITATIVAWNHDRNSQSNPTRTGNHKDHNKYFRCIIVWLIVPLFVVLVGVSIVACITVVMVAAANSDFCYPAQYTIDPNAVLPPTIANNLGNYTDTSVDTVNGQTYITPLNSPDVSTLQILLYNGYNIGSQDYFIVAFYIAQCTKENPWDFLAQYVPVAQEIVSNLERFEQSLNETAFVQEITIECGKDFSNLFALFATIKDYMKTLLVTIFDILNLIRCDSIVPIYQQIFYSGTCEYSIKAVIWMFSAALVTSTAGLLMVTFRSALYPTVYTDVYDSGIQESAGPTDDNISHQRTDAKSEE